MCSDTWHMVNRENGSFSIENRNKGIDKVEITPFNARESKPIIDEIKTVFVKHYSFTDEELDFSNIYDIKYRMGKELERDDEA